MGTLIDTLKQGSAERVDAARDFIDRFLEIRAGSLPAGKLPAKVRWRATRDDGYESARKAKQSFEKAVQAVSSASPVKAAFSVASLMYHASSASLSFLSLTKREKMIGTIVGANMAALTAIWPGGDAPVKYDDIEAITKGAVQQPAEQKESSAAAPAQTAVEYTLSINDDLSLTFKDRKYYDRAKYLMESPALETYMGAAVSDEIRAALVAGDALTPYPYAFWQGQAFAESSFRKNALNEATLARGIMQMTPSTTLEILYDMKDKPQYGFIPEAQLVTKKFDKEWVASYSVVDGIDEQALVASVAYDPLKAVMVAAEYNSKYFALLQDKYPDAEMTSVNAYVLHWQGYAGSQKLFNADPETPAVKVYGAKSDVVQNHKTIFYEDAENTKGPRTVEEMFSYLETDRGLGNIEIPKIAEWGGSPASVSYIPLSEMEVAEKYKESLAPLISRIPKKRPDIMTASNRPMPKPSDL